MDGRRGSESAREASRPSARSLLQASWFRVVVVFAAVSALALVVVPWSLRLAARGAGDRPPVARSSGAAADGVEPLSRDDALPTAAPGLVLPVRAAVAAGVPAALAGAAGSGRPPTPADASPMLAQATAPKPGDAKPEAAPKAAAAKAAAARDAKSAPESGAPYWVQVGAFRDPQAAKRVAQQLRDANFRVQESTVTRPVAGGVRPAATPPSSGAPAAPSDRYEVLVIGSASELEPKLAAKGLATRAGAEGVAITPTLVLNEAVELSKQLTADGLTVRVRRVATAAPSGGGGRPAAASAASPAGASAPPAAAPAGGEETLYRVRVGEFPDRAAAMAALQQLEARGFKPFLARGGQ